VMACKDNQPTEIAGEVADLFYHTLVALAHHQVSIRDVYKELQKRRK
jgi:phosphoribosyl-AMP cyclohydrolase / phosphoribosyl-ATP pyrophosphohydrolase